MSLFIRDAATRQNAITELDGHSVNVGYLSLWNLMVLDIILSFVTIIAGAVTQVFDVKHAFPFQNVAWMLTALWGTFGTALTAVGVFLMGDRRPQPAPPPGTLVQKTETTITQPAPDGATVKEGANV